MPLPYSAAKVLLGMNAQLMNEVRRWPEMLSAEFRDRRSTITSAQPMLILRTTRKTAADVVDMLAGRGIFRSPFSLRESDFQQDYLPFAMERTPSSCPSTTVTSSKPRPPEDAFPSEARIVYFLPLPTSSCLILLRNDKQVTCTLVREIHGLKVAETRSAASKQPRHRCAISHLQLQGTWMAVSEALSEVSNTARKEATWWAGHAITLDLCFRDDKATQLVDPGPAMLGTMFQTLRSQMRNSPVPITSRFWESEQVDV